MLKVALLIIDIQEDFLPPNGTLVVPNGREVIEQITKLCDLSKYPWLAVAVTQDWHPPNHTSFASQHGVEPFTDVEFEHPLEEKNACTGKVKTKVQTVWPDHCVQGTFGASIEKSIMETYYKLPEELPKIVVQKGCLHDREYYLCFSDVWKLHKTDLEDFLLKNDINHVVCVGLAYDFCVLNSAIDSQMSGFSTAVLKNCCRSVYQDKIAETEKLYGDAGVALFESIDEYLTSLKK
ncbi:hypothetical protein PUMCH_000416 [Australozyma saopauloensis]|uniref:nicotinamidase n=1 Tax=Australozyma saopauloensis TaxID=291208 RepID=A0AAX4H3W3_9ASCO|nr:hypothetical protein PUMCH_000416 [[Candida] saopauloensis]